MRMTDADISKELASPPGPAQCDTLGDAPAPRWNYAGARAGTGIDKRASAADGQ
jgi:hypothetical protein